MSSKRRPSTDALKAAHETAEGLFRSGLIDKTTMNGFDALCLEPVRDLSPRKIKSLRERHKVSQPVFAAYLNVSAATVKAWEQGAKKPAGPSLKLLNLIERKGLEAVA
ncbi:MAG: DNA-binding transcriptional regulator [Parvibaculum sp.]|uniref:helix-turn-helix domain-containing protein n=1 Tax=Parvibaculum sp. TaxID=2024848 RepID=UPI000CB35C2E|nr:DNA-binding transcriptional regulator [Parvibaculum sp.]MDZ4380902.1 DNA-binding transcriptional regulator [Parvibaculum sp.]PKP77131.1 MAG: transcriptional regulator [Alphaproteobacteria bacterium HGW-Alphaproteobacteria-3]